MFPEVNSILEHFLRHPTQQIHLRELARRTGFSPGGALKAVRKLVRRDIVIERKGMAVTNYQAATGSRLWLALKRAYNLYTLQASGLVEALGDAYEEPAAIVLFGSYARGDDTETSDIDIAVVTPLVRAFNRKPFEKSLGKHINIIELELSKAKEEFIESLANGIVLHGHLTLPWPSPSTSLSTKAS